MMLRPLPAQILPCGVSAARSRPLRPSSRRSVLLRLSTSRMHATISTGSRWKACNVIHGSKRQNSPFQPDLHSRSLAAVIDITVCSTPRPITTQTRPIHHNSTIEQLLPCVCLNSSSSCAPSRLFRLHPFRLIESTASPLTRCLSLLLSNLTFSF